MSTRRRRRRVKNTYRAHRRRHHNPESRRARRRAARAASRHRRHNPFHHRRRRVHNRFRFRHGRKRNPMDSIGDIQNDIVAAGIGAASAVALDVLLAYAPVPASLQSGWGQVLTQGVGAIALGMLASMAVGSRTGSLVTIGGLTVTAYGALQMALGPTLGQNIRGFGGLADFSDFRGGRMGAYMGAGRPVPRVGAYMAPAARLAAAAPAASGLAAKQKMGAYMRAQTVGRFNGFNGLAASTF